MNEDDAPDTLRLITTAELPIVRFPEDDEEEDDDEQRGG